MDSLDFFSSEAIDKLNRSTFLYKNLKKYLLKAEQMDKDRKTQPQILLELRNALDHFMRIFLTKNGFNEKILSQDEKELTHYINNQMDKFYGHLYRAAYDILDWLSIDIHDKIDNLLESYPTQTISEVIPEYYSIILPKLDKISLEISEIREKKDVDNENDIFDKENLAKASFDNYNIYCEKIDKMLEVYNVILLKINSLNNFKRKSRKEWVKNNLVGIFIGVIGIVVALFK